MTVTLKFYHDALLQQEVNPTNPVLATQTSDGQAPAVDKRLWLGGPNAAVRWRDAAAPGTGTLRIRIDDSNSAGGLSASAVRLAPTQAALDTATPGAELNTAITQINGGSANAYSFWLRIQTPAGTAVGAYDDLSLSVTEVVEEPA